MALIFLNLIEEFLYQKGIKKIKNDFIAEFIILRFNLFSEQIKN